MNANSFAFFSLNRNFALSLQKINCTWQFENEFSLLLFALSLQKFLVKRKQH